MNKDIERLKEEFVEDIIELSHEAVTDKYFRKKIQSDLNTLLTETAEKQRKEDWKIWGASYPGNINTSDLITKNTEE